jgi:hypothetical protein
MAMSTKLQFRGSRRNVVNVSLELLGNGVIIRSNLALSGFLMDVYVILGPEKPFEFLHGGVELDLLFIVRAGDPLVGDPFGFKPSVDSLDTILTRGEKIHDLFRRVVLSVLR